MKQDNLGFEDIREQMIYHVIKKNGITSLRKFSSFKFYDEYSMILKAVKQYFKDIDDKIKALIPDDKLQTHEDLSKASILNSIRIDEFKLFNKIKDEKIEEYTASLRIGNNSSTIKRTGDLINKKLNEITIEKEIKF